MGGIISLESTIAKVKAKHCFLHKNKKKCCVWGVSIQNAGSYMEKLKRLPYMYIVFFFSIFVKNISIIILTNQQDVTKFYALPFL